MKSFRFRLAVRATAMIAVGFGVLAVLAYLAVRQTLDAQINASLLNVASIQAASVTEAPSGTMRFHEWDLTPEEAVQLRELNRFAQIWTQNGRSMLRTKHQASFPGPNSTFRACGYAPSTIPYHALGEHTSGTCCKSPRPSGSGTACSAGCSCS